MKLRFIYLVALVYIACGLFNALYSVVLWNIIDHDAMVIGRGSVYDALFSVNPLPYAACAVIVALVAAYHSLREQGKMWVVLSSLSLLVAAVFVAPMIVYGGIYRVFPSVFVLLLSIALGYISQSQKMSLKRVMVFSAVAIGSFLVVSVLYELFYERFYPLFWGMHDVRTPITSPIEVAGLVAFVGNLAFASVVSYLLVRLIKEVDGYVKNTAGGSEKSFSYYVSFSIAAIVGIGAYKIFGMPWKTTQGGQLPESAVVFFSGWSEFNREMFTQYFIKSAPFDYVYTGRDDHILYASFQPVVAVLSFLFIAAFNKLEYFRTFIGLFFLYFGFYLAVMQYAENLLYILIRIAIIAICMLLLPVVRIIYNAARNHYISLKEQASPPGVEAQ